MTNPEQSELQPSKNDSSGNNSQFENEAKAFCRIMERLNAVALGQIRGLLEIAVTAGDKLHSANPANKTAPINVSEQINQIKQVAEKNYRNNLESLKKSAASGGEEDFLQTLEQALRLAFENSVANQQELNELGVSILATAAEQLLKS